MSSNNKALEELFLNHQLRCLTSHQFKHFILLGKRYVTCDSCGRVVSTDSCVYYGGPDCRMLSGGCRNCYGQEVQA